MEKSKKIIIIIAIIAIIAIAIVIGVIKVLNTNKESITAFEFETAMQGKGYIVQDAKSQFEEYEYINQVYIAVSKDYSYQIEFYELSDENYATMFYNTNKTIFESYKKNNATETNVNIKNYSKYTLNTKEQYMLLSKIDNTVIYIKTESENKDNINKLLKEIGY